VRESFWRWFFLPSLVKAAFAEKPNIPLPVWAKQNVFLDRRMTTRPGYYDPDEYPGTWAFQEILRTRHVWEKEIEESVVVIVDPATEGATCMEVHDVAAMKSTQTGFTEAFLNEIRYCAKHDPQNVIFAIDNAKQAAEVNEIRLQPTLRRMGEEVMPTDEDDAGKFLIKLRRMLIYFLGSYSAGAFTQKMCELGGCDELEKHGNKSSAEELRGRMKTSPRRLCVLMSRPEKAGGPIDKEHAKGSMHVREVPCPSCGKYQELLQDQMKFGHCKNLLGEWDKKEIMRDTYFECVHCKGRINESDKRWMNARLRWRRTNFNAEPNFISFQISDFLSYDDSISWGRLALKYINSRGDPTARQTYRNEHEGLPYQVRATSVAVDDLLQLRGKHKLGQIPWKPDVIILGGDVGQAYVKYGVVAARFTSDQEGEAAVIDRGILGSPAEFALAIRNKKYRCLANKKQYQISFGIIDAKWNRNEVHKACLRLPRRMYPSAGISADLSAQSISFRRVPTRPAWFRLLLYIDRDAKNELYVERIASWVHWLKTGRKPDEIPLTPRLWLPSDLAADDWYVVEHTKEPLVQVQNATHSAKEFVFKRIGPNHGGDCTKVCLVGIRLYIMGNQPGAEDDIEAALPAPPQTRHTAAAGRKESPAATDETDDDTRPPDVF
jgi:hypothetical protein